MARNLKSLSRVLVAVATSVLLSAVHGLAQAPPASAPGTATSPAPAPAAPALPPPAPLEQAFEKAAGDVLQNARVPDGGRIDLLIDPLIDGNTGAQSSATRSMEAHLRQLITTRFADKFQVQPFTTDNLAKSPFVFIGTFTPIHATSNALGPKDAYRICFAVLDLKSGLIVSKGFARAAPEGINPVPTPAFASGPLWVKDPAIEGYVKTCQGPKAGDPINPVYLERITVAALISEAIQAYDEGRYAQALDAYTKARALPGGDQLRVHNGLYLTNWKLNRRAEADKALGDVVDYGLKGERLGMMILFVKNTTTFLPSTISPTYPAWLKAIADKSAAANACLEVVGHASHTGTEAVNDRLSAQRAAAIRARLARLSAPLAKTLKSSGQGYRENIVGNGRDDVTDALDRRVEFKVAKCS